MYFEGETGPAVPIVLEASKMRAPMTEEQWRKSREVSQGFFHPKSKMNGAESGKKLR